MRRLATTLALAVCLLGCTGEPVKLMTLDQAASSLCCIPCVAGVLVPDVEIGTVIRVDKAGNGFSGCELHATQGTSTERVAWPAGYTGRRVGSEVEVLNEKGEVVARTGQRYECTQEYISKAYVCRRAGAADARTEPPPPFDLASVKARFAAECEDPAVLETETCDLIDIDGMSAGGDNLFVPLTSYINGVRAHGICEQIAAAHDDLDDEPLGYRILRTSYPGWASRQPTHSRPEPG